MLMFLHWYFEHLYLFEIICNDQDPTWPYTNTLKYLLLKSCTYSQYFNILHQSPQLRTFITGYRSMKEDYLSLSLSTSVSSFPLESLAIDGGSFTCEQFESLVSPVPSLRYLKIISERTQFDASFDGSFWEELIPTKLPQLEQLHLSISFNCAGSDVYRSLQSIITSFQTSFRIVDKHWFVTCAYHPVWNTITLCTTHRDIYSSEKSFVCSISSTNDRCRLTQGTNRQANDTDDDKVLENSVLSTSLLKLNRS